MADDDLDKKKKEEGEAEDSRVVVPKVAPAKKSKPDKAWKNEKGWNRDKDKGWVKDKESTTDGRVRDKEAERTKEEKNKKTTKVTFVQEKWFDDSVSYKEGELWNEKGDNYSTDASLHLGYAKATAVSEISLDTSAKELVIAPIQAKGKVAIVHGETKGEFDIGGFFGDIFSSDESEKPRPEATPGAPGAGPFAARVGDLTSHGTPLAPGIGSIDVLIGGLPAWRAIMDTHACPVVKGTIPDVGGPVLVGSPTVLINFMQACRMGDMVVEVPGGPNAIAAGCPTVMIGTSGGGGSGSPEIKKTEKGTKFVVSGKADGDVGVLEGTAELAAVIKPDEVGARGKIGVMAAVAKGTFGTELAVPVPFTDHAVTVGVGGEGSVLSAGASAEASAGWTAEKGFKAKLGAKAAWGLGGGLNFTVGFK